jgi:hypothetical protein
MDVSLQSRSLVAAILFFLLSSSAHAATGEFRPIDGASTCVSTDSNHICIGVKLVSYLKDTTSVIDRAQSIALIDRVNKIWNQCNVGFQLETYESVDPSSQNLDYDMDWYNDGDIVRKAFADTTRFLMVAAGSLAGGYGTTGATWDAGTGDGFFGSLIDGAYAQDAITVAHEFGHYQGLNHVQDETNLLYPYAEETNRALSADQCEVARSSNQKYWQKMLR